MLTQLRVSALFFLVISAGLSAQQCCLDNFMDGLSLEAEYLCWELSDTPKVIPLVVRGPTVPEGTPVLDQPGFTIVLGDRKIKNNWQPGGRFAIRYNRGCGCITGLESNYFFLATEVKEFCTGSRGLPTSSFLAVPYFNTNTESESSAAIARPGIFSGNASLTVSNRMQSWDFNAVMPCPYITLCCPWQVNLVGGFRYWDFIQRLKFHTSSPNLPPLVDVYDTRDKFYTRNNFYGGQIGATVSYVWDCLLIDIKGKLAIGAMYQATDIHGHLISNTFNGLGTPVTYEGGYFAVPSNAGHHHRTTFAVIPEGNLNVGFQVTDYIRLQVGYSFIFVNDVLWASKQMNRHINPTQSSALETAPNPTLIGDSEPKASLNADSLWAHGLNIGFVYTY